MIRCKSCHAPILFARTEQGALIPLDAELVLDGRGNIVVGGDGIARVVTSGSGDRLSHFASCPNASQHRRPATRRR